jgi:hypothetical protein
MPPDRQEKPVTDNPIPLLTRQDGVAQSRLVVWL